jgi:hypothetical protein
MDCPRRTDEPKVDLVRWWRYAVVRGPGIPAEMNGRWFDMDAMPKYVHSIGPFPGYSDAQCVPTDRWEQRDDGQVAVVYEWTRSS